MERIKNLGTRLGSTGRIVSWALYLCLDCHKEVERPKGNGDRYKSCGCSKNESISKSLKGHSISEETRQKMRDSHPDNSGRKNPMFGRKGELSSMYGKKHTKETREKQSKAKKDKYIGENNPMYGTHRLGENNPFYGKKHTKEVREKQSKIRIEKGLSKGKNNPNWNNGSSFEPYSPEFNKEKKAQVLERDNYTCQNPNCEHLSEGLDVHHIDYDKKNNSLDNLTTLCDKCHTKTNGKNKRYYFTEFYQNIMINRIMECLL